MFNILLRITSTIMILASLLTFATAALAFDCSDKELERYNFESIKGVHSYTTLKNTPPSQTNITWNVGICQPISAIKDCPANSDICGVTSILRKDEKPVVSEVVSFKSDLQKAYESSDNGIKVIYKGANWGDVLVNAELNFQCDKDSQNNEFTLDQWDGTNLKLSMKTKAACITSKEDKKKEKHDNGESWGWFTWIFIFLVLFLSIYIIGGAWFQYNKGNAIDFQSALKEVVENFIELLKGLPSFGKEIIEKFTGRSNRGEYSAV